VPAAEKRLERLRQIAATCPAGDFAEAVRRTGRARKASEGETGAQAQAQLAELLRHRGRQQDRHCGMEDWRVKPLASDYGKISVTVRFTCKIEQLVNFLAAGQRPQLLDQQMAIIGGSRTNRCRCGSAFRAW
jgi:hypothetical protein